jgi:hypothetical protein
MKRTADFILCLLAGGGAGWSLGTGHWFAALLYAVAAAFFYNQLTKEH